MKYLFVLIATLTLVCQSNKSFGQTKGDPLKPLSKNIHFQIFGGTSIYSLNYEHQLFRLGNLGFNGIVGLGRTLEFPLIGDNNIWATSPKIGFELEVGQNKHRLGISTMFEAYKGNHNPFQGAEEVKIWKYTLSPQLSYKFVPKDVSKAFVKLNLSYPVQINNFDKFRSPLYIPVGLSIGKYFGSK